MSELLTKANDKANPVKVNYKIHRPEKELAGHNKENEVGGYLYDLGGFSLPPETIEFRETPPERALDRPNAHDRGSMNQEKSEDIAIDRADGEIKPVFMQQAAGQESQKSGPVRVVERVQG